MKLTFTLALLCTVISNIPLKLQAQAANVNDSLALVDIYYASAPWGGQRWLSGPVSTWYGVTLNADGRVIAISLANNGVFGGTISPSIGNLAKLQTLYLGYCYLTGSIPPTMGNLTNLTLLNLNNNQLTGSIPATMGKLVNLTRFDARVNKLSGAIPDALGNLSSLEYVDLDANQLNGEIPVTIGNLGKLQFLDLSSNTLSGAIPTSIGNATALARCMLNNNQLTGSIPASVGNLTNLIKLDLTRNSLSGSIPASIGNLTKLQYFSAETNQLTGVIPLTIGNLASITELYLDGNQLSGSIPATFGNLSHLSIAYLGGNQLTGNIPAELGGLTNIYALNLANNQLTGSIPATLGSLPRLHELGLSHNQLTGNIPAELGTMPALSDLYISYNQLTGNIPTTFEKTANLRYLITDHNQLSGALPAFLADSRFTASIAFEVNNYTFNGLEEIVTNHKSGLSYWPQNPMPLHFNSSTKTFSVYAAKYPYNCTYTWYNGKTVVQTTTVDSTFKPTSPGNYWVAVTNSIAKRLTLNSDTITVTAADLPVNFVNFTAQQSLKGNLLYWQTATEVNSAWFNVQRSADGIQFTNIAKLPAAGNSTILKNYNYIDGATLTGNVFYRIYETDKDGRETYSKTVKLGAGASNVTAFIVYPNPVHDKLSMQLTGITGKATITIVNTAGARVQQKQVSITDGQQVSIYTAMLPAGNYFLQVTYATGQTQQQKFFKQ